MTVSLHGQVVIVTGSGRGLGRAYALDLARHGATVIVNSRAAAQGGPPVGAELVADEIIRSGGQAVWYPGSVADQAVAAGLVECALERFGRLDAVVNNAGQTHRAELADITPEDVAAQFTTHVTGALLVSQRAFETMRAAGYGRIVMIGSHVATFGRGQAGAYAAAMGGVTGLAHALAIEGRDQGILVNTVLPVAATRRPQESWAVRESPEAIAAKPFKHRMTAEFVAPLVTYLASAACHSTKGVYAAVAGRYMRIFNGVTPGWYSTDDEPPMAAAIAEHWQQIGQEGGYRTPDTNLADFAQIAELNAASAGEGQRVSGGAAAS